MKNKTRVYSELTFGELASNLAFITVYWNGHIIYDDPILSQETIESEYTDEYRKTHFGISGLNYIKEHYGNKKVYQMTITVAQFHHCILSVIGEE